MSSAECPRAKHQWYPLIRQGAPVLIFLALNATINMITDVKTLLYNLRRFFILVCILVAPYFELFCDDFWLQKEEHPYLPAEGIALYHSAGVFGSMAMTA